MRKQRKKNTNLTELLKFALLPGWFIWLIVLQVNFNNQKSIIAANYTKFETHTFMIMNDIENIIINANESVPMFNTSAVGIRFQNVASVNPNPNYAVATALPIPSLFFLYNIDYDDANFYDSEQDDRLTIPYDGKYVFALNIRRSRFRWISTPPPYYEFSYRISTMIYNNQSILKQDDCFFYQKKANTGGELISNYNFFQGDLYCEFNNLKQGDYLKIETQTQYFGNTTGTSLTFFSVFYEPCILRRLPELV